jgi:hypothetical protein
MKLFRHEVSAWTVGQLRKALADFPDDMPVRVAPLEEPGGELEAPLQVVTNAEVRVFADASGGDRPVPPTSLPVSTTGSPVRRNAGAVRGMVRAGTSR